MTSPWVLPSELQCEPWWVVGPGQGGLPLPLQQIRYYISQTYLEKILDSSDSAPVEHCEVQNLGDGKFRRLYRGDVNQTEDGLDCLNWREVNASQAWNETAWLLGDHNYCRNPDWAEAREFCYVNETQRGFCVVKSCGENTVTSLQTDTLGLHQFPCRCLLVCY